MNTVITVAGLMTVAAITPGPNNFVVMGAAAREGFAAAIPSILGVVVGSLALLVAVWAGAETAFEAAPWSRAVLLWAGCLYLIWLGAVLIRQAGRPDSASHARVPSTALGLAVFQLLNPKSWVLVMTATAAISEGREGSSHLAILAAILLIVTCTCLSIWALAGAMIAKWLERPAARGWFDRAMGGLLIGSSLLLVL